MYYALLHKMKHQSDSLFTINYYIYIFLVFFIQKQVQLLGFFFFSVQL